MAENCVDRAQSGCGIPCLGCAESMHWSIVTRDGPDIVEGQCLKRRQWGNGCPDRVPLRHSESSFPR